MSNSNKLLITAAVLVLSLASGTALAQDATDAINLDENVQAQDLGIAEPRILPDSPFYFLKNWARGMQSLLTFDSVKKAELKLKFANEKLIEAKKIIEKTNDPKIIKKATENYQQEIKQIKKQADKIKEKAKESVRVENFLDKFIQQQTLHQKLLDKLEAQVPADAFEKIKEAKERHLETFQNVMLKLEDRKEEITEKLDEILETQKGSQFKNFKNLEILKELEEKAPEEAKQAIQRAQENTLKRLQENLEKMNPETQEKFKEYVENISGDKEKQLEVMENVKARIQSSPLTPVQIQLKEKLEEGKAKVIEKIEEKLEKLNCPLWTPPASNFCEEGRIIVEKNPETGCPLPPKCVVPGETTMVNPASAYCEKLGYKLKIKNNPDGSQYGVCIFPDDSECEEWSFYRGECGIKYRENAEEKSATCIALWNPVCGKDGKTYSNECFTKLAGVEIDHKGRCEEKECQTDADCPQLRCGPADTTKDRCIGVRYKCVAGKCQIQAAENEPISQTPTVEPQPAVCAQVITLAISPQGICKEFPTSCDVPKSWKKVDACPKAKCPDIRCVWDPCPDKHIPDAKGCVNCASPCQKEE